MNIRRVVLDVDMAASGPSVLELGEAIAGVASVEAANLTVTEIDLETVGLVVTVEGSALDYRALAAAIERAGAVIHSVDELVIGDRVVEPVQRSR